MKRRVFVGGAGLVGIAANSVLAQTPQRVARVAFLTTAASDARPAFLVFRDRLRELGWIEGRSLVLKFYLGGSPGKERLEPMAREIAASGADVVLADGAVPSQVMAGASSIIPIVSITGLDPTTIGLAKSLARPGGNITGVTLFTDLLNPKRLELLREMVPSAGRVGFTYSSGREELIQSVLKAGRALGLDMRPFAIDSSSAIPHVLSAAALADIDAFMVGPEPFLDAAPERIVEPLTAAGKPAIYPDKPYVAIGGLASYGVNIADMFRRLAGYVDRVLRGENPSAMPFEQPERFEFTLNMQTVRRFGLTLPPVVLARADEVIE